MSDIALQNAVAYAAQHHLRLAERLGFGIHGTVLVAEHEGKHDIGLSLALHRKLQFCRMRIWAIQASRLSLGLAS